MSKPPFPYPGGKRRLSALITDVIVPHSTYVEPFVGGGAIYFAKEPARKNVISDADPNVISFYKDFSCKKVKKCESVKDVCEFSEKSIEKVKKGKKVGVCGFLAARRFSSLAKAKDLDSRFCDIRPLVGKELKGVQCKDVEKRIKRAKIEVGDFREVSEKYDSKDTFFFMDPPYHGVWDGYNKRGVKPKDVLDFAKKSKGKVLVTYNDHPDVRKAAKGLNVVRIPSVQSMKSVNGKKQRTSELLITNFPIHIKVK